MLARIFILLSIFSVCYNKISILDCQFGAWEEGPCSLSCGGGVKVLTREILKEARGHGACAGETEIVSPCSSQPCDLDCQWSDWAEEAACSKSCGGGKNVAFVFIYFVRDLPEYLIFMMIINLSYI